MQDLQGWNDHHAATRRPANPLPGDARLGDGQDRARHDQGLRQVRAEVKAPSANGKTAPPEWFTDAREAGELILRDIHKFPPDKRAAVLAENGFYLARGKLGGVKLVAHEGFGIRLWQSMSDDGQAAVRRAGGMAKFFAMPMHQLDALPDSDGLKADLKQTRVDGARADRQAKSRQNALLNGLFKATKRGVGGAGYGRTYGLPPATPKMALAAGLPAVVARSDRPPQQDRPVMLAKSAPKRAQNAWTAAARGAGGNALADALTAIARKYAAMLDALDRDPSVPAAEKPARRRYLMELRQAEEREARRREREKSAMKKSTKKPTP